MGDSLDSCLLITKGEGGLLHLKFWFLSKPSLGAGGKTGWHCRKISNIKNIQILPRGNDNKGGVGEERSIVGRCRRGDFLPPIFADSLTMQNMTGGK